MNELEKIARKYRRLEPTLSERGRRLWAGAEADALGRGGVAGVARATGMAISTVRKGRDEVRAGVSLPGGRDRRPGGGRLRLEKRDPELLVELDSLVRGTTRGDPESPLLWTCKSLRVLARELTSANHPVSPSKVGELLRAAGYSLMGNRKVKEGTRHPDRDAQFQFIDAKAQDFMSRGLPVISVDSKKREPIGEFANAGREWRPKGEAVDVLSHDFCTEEMKATPYGVYDVRNNSGFVNVGTDNNTPAFAARSIGKWWERMGSARYPKAKELFLTADAGGSNSAKAHVWKTSLQKLSDETGVAIHVSHFPPGTSKWNKIEHRLFSFITLNWRGKPLVTFETVVALIAATTTSNGLKVRAELDREKYPVGVSATPRELRGLQLERNPFHGEWNYVLHPRTAVQLAAAESAPPDHERRPHAERRKRWMELFREQRRSQMNHSEFCRARGLKLQAYFAALHRMVGPSSPIRRKRASVE
jgi:hypothetical protein